MFRLRNILILFIAALIIIFCARAGWLGSFSRSLTLDVSGFFVRVVNYPGQKISYYWNLFQFRSAVLRENTALKLQLENLQHKYDQTRDLQARVHELEQMLNLQRDYDFELLPAPVVFRDEFSWSKTIIISRGRRDGLLPSMPVVRGGKTLTYLNNLECTGVVPTNTSNWQPIIDITGIPAIIDNCTSTSTTDALSANQGRVLSENIAANEESGAKNFNVYPYTETTKVENGLTFTDNGDGTITVSAASYPYTVPNQTNFICHNFLEQLSLDQGNYILSGSPIVSDDIYVTFVYYDNEYTGVDSKGTDQPFYLPLKTNHETLRLFFGANSVITEALLFKPMIRDARIIDDTFVPFAKTNKQLTDDLSIKTALISEVYNPLLLNYARVTYNKLGFVCVRLDGCKNLVNATYNDIFTLPLDVPRPSQEMCWNIPIESEVYRIIVNTSGTVRIYPYGGVSASGNIVETLTYLAQ